MEYGINVRETYMYIENFFEKFFALLVVRLNALKRNGELGELTYNEIMKDIFAGTEYEGYDGCWDPNQGTELKIFSDAYKIDTKL